MPFGVSFVRAYPTNGCSLEARRPSHLLYPKSQCEISHVEKMPCRSAGGVLFAASGVSENKLLLAWVVFR
jgi:hypothetical protein